MCILLAINSRAKRLPTLEELQNCEESNSDGGGMAWAIHGKIKVRKDLSAVEIYNILQSLPEDIAGAIVHFRLSTVAGDRVRLQHPFEVSTSAKMEERFTTTKPVLAHNGHLSGYQGIAKTLELDGAILPSGVISDSRLMAFMADRFDNLYIGNLYDEKTAVLMPSGVIHISKYNLWTLDTDSGLLWSNGGYKWKAKTVVFTGYGKTYQNKTNYEWDNPIEDAEEDKTAIITPDLFELYCDKCAPISGVWDCFNCTVYHESLEREGYCEECVLQSGPCNLSQDEQVDCLERQVKAAELARDESQTKVTTLID